MIEIKSGMCVHKFPLAYTRNTIELSDGATVLAAQCQNDIITLWVLVDTNAPKVQRTFIVKGTGHFFDHIHNVTYVGTCQDSTQLVWHVFELLNEHLKRP